MNKPRMKKYLLFLMGDFKEIETVLQEVTEVISLVMDSDHLRYIHHDNLIICYFESRAPLEEINKFFDDDLSNVFESYFLINKPKNMGYRLDSELSNHLFHFMPGKNSKSKTNNKIPRINELMEGFAEHFIEAVRKEEKVDDFKLDDVLDKINEEGILSLTTDEKNFLKNMSK